MLSGALARRVGEEVSLLLRDPHADVVGVVSAQGALTESAACDPFPKPPLLKALMRITGSRYFNRRIATARSAAMASVQGSFSSGLDHFQTFLGVAGMIPVIGGLADAADGAIYAARGQHGMAALSFAAMVPIGGQAATVAKWGIKHAD